MIHPDENPTLDRRPALVVLISGSGSNLQAIIDAIESDYLHARIACVISNRANVKGLQRARQHHIKTHLIEHEAFDSREAFDQAMIEHIDPYQPALVILAGFMRILTPAFIQHYQNRLLNIHPSLLPAYKGLHTHRRVLEAGDHKHGASVHLVSNELDSGQLVLQAEVNVLANDNEEQLAQRVLQQEHVIYPMAIKWLLEGTMQIRAGQLLYKNQLIKRPLLWKDKQLIEP